PPYYHSLGGVVRTLKMAEYLLDHGVDVYVLAAKGKPISYFGYEDTVKRLKVTYVDNLWQAFYNDQQMRFQNQAGSLLSPDNPVSSFIRNAIPDLCVPDIFVFFINSFVKQAKRLIKDNGIPNVLISTPPHSLQLAGLKLKRHFKERIQLLVDYRDSWNTRGLCKKRNPVSQWFNAKCERDVLSAADRFLYCSQPMLGKIHQTIAPVESKATLMCNGYDRNAVPAADPKAKNKILTISFLGRMSDQPESTMNPGNFFRIISEFPHPVQCRLVGPVLISQSWRDRLGDKLHISPPVSHPQAIDLMRDSDILLILYSDRDGSDEVISGKLYDYMVAERPVLVIGPPDMEARRIVLNEGIGYAADIDDEAEMRKVLNDIYARWESGQLPAYSIESLKEYSRDSQYAKLLPLLKP
ncbi:MAG: hypothetical protein U1D99_01635, partial [Candidatus Omnitrophota bacterium]|nr:hypothetical protein [Candidatus Omnitrophota bacterium]